MHVQDFEVLDVDMWEDSREASQDEGAELHEGSEPSEDSEPEEEEASRENTIKLLEDMVVDFLEQLSDALPSADNPKPKKADNKKVIMQLADRRKPVKADGSMGTRNIIFPQKARPDSARPLAQLLRVVDLMHEALTDDMPTTKRDMFYKDVQLFGTQSVVNKLVDDVAASIGVGRADLHVRASSKGLLCGSGLTMNLRHGDVIQGNTTEGTLIPPSEEISRFEVSEDLSWVLIVEKEAVFQTLCHLDFSSHPSLPGPGVIVTGKGYPDVATRQLVCTLSNNLSSTIPIIALVDADPYGIDILSVYKYGSTNMSHEQGSLAAPRIRWGGVMSSELAGLGVDRDMLIPITKHDEKKALAMLQRPNLPKKWRKELQYMLHNRRKAEIEVLSSAPRMSIKRNAREEEDDGAESTDEEPTCDVTKKSRTKTQECILVQYLLTKVTKAVNDCRRKYA